MHNPTHCDAVLSLRISAIADAADGMRSFERVRPYGTQRAKSIQRVPDL